MRSSQNLAKVQPRGQDWAELIAHTARGEEEALAALYDDTSALVNGLALRILGDAGAAEEVTADVYLQIWRRAVTYDPARGAPLGWLLTLARSRAIDRLRTGATRRMRTERLRHAMAMPSNEPGPEERSALSERRRLVRGPRPAAGRATPNHRARLLRGSEPRRDRGRSSPAARHGEDAHPSRHDAAPPDAGGGREGSVVKHVRSTPEQRTQAALHSLGTLALDQRRRFVEHLEEGCPVCRAEVASFEAVVDDIALAAAPVPPRRELRAALLARAAAEVTPMPLPPFHFVLEGEGAWTEVEPRVFRKDLAVFPGSGPSVFLIRIEPGAHAATHRHRGVEDCYVISGDLHVAGRHIHAGDHHRAAAGTTHEGIRTDGGCLLLIVDAAA